MKKNCLSRRSKTVFILTSVIVVCTSCVTMADYNFSAINKNLDNGEYNAVYAELEKPSGYLYRNTDKALEQLDKGVVSHYAGENDRSNKELSAAETIIQNTSAASITQAAASMVTNDTVKDYSADPYEEVYINIFKALNYIELGKTDDAFVEIRRFDNKLKELTVKYQAQIEQQKLQLKNDASSVPSSQMHFIDSALARYLSMLMYRSEGDTDNASVDYKKIIQAYRLQPTLYQFKMPDSISEEMTVSKKAARLNVIAFSGRAPLKVEQDTPLLITNGWYHIALPVMEKRTSEIAYAEVAAISKDTGKQSLFRLDKIESIEDIALDTYQEKFSLITAKTIGRVIAKMTTTAVLDVASDKSDNDTLSLLFGVLGAASRANALLSERADVRTSRYFPASALAGGITLDPGLYDITVTFKTNNGRTAASYAYPAKQVSAGGLNLVESYCLK